MRELINTLNEATIAYDAGHPIMPDSEWDKLYFKLKNMESESGIIYPDSPTQKIFYDSVNKLEKVTHNHKMLSLDKTKDWGEFLNYFNPNYDVVGMLKMDGLTCSLKYSNGNLVGAETRGNGTIGENILHNAKIIASIPQHISYTEDLIIDGEIICTYQDFKDFASEYKNPRNFAAGSIRLLDAKECANRKLTFVVWNIVEGFSETKYVLDKFFKCKQLGFTVVPYTSSFDWDAKEYLINKGKKYGYPIDGLVGRYNDIEYGKSLGETDHHSRAAYAFKFYDEEYETILKDIVYDIGRTGVLTPVAVYEPVDMDGSVCERASLHNLSIMNETLGTPYYGQKIKVYKSNMIIPQISWAEKQGINEDNFHEFIPLPNTCPICGKPTKTITSDSGTITLVCDNPQCDGKLINKLDHFLGKKGLDIKGISEATLEKLIDWEWVTCFTDIFNLDIYKIDWMKKDGFGPKSVMNILDSIEKTAKSVPLENFIAAIGIPLIGNVQAKEIVKRFHSWEDFRNAVTDKFDFARLDGFGESKTYEILHFDYAEADKVFDYLNVVYTAPVEEDASLAGMSICITGSLKLYKNRDALAKEIEAHGGKVVGSVSKNTKYLINNDKASTSSKNVSANKLGIPIISEEEFKQKFLEK